MYIFRSDPRKNGVTVLMTIEEGSYESACTPTVALLLTGIR